jgi:arabinogalactan oligomer/maltooligosaccharide transport system permease protein
VDVVFRALPLWALLLALGWPVHARAVESVRVWHAYRETEEQALEEIVDGFADADVDLLAIPYDGFAAKVTSAIPLGSGPDIFIDSHERLGDYHRRGVVGPVGDALELDAYPDSVREAVLVDGEAYGVPLNVKPLALYINTAYLQAAPPSLEEIAALELPPGVFPLAYEAMDPYAHVAVLHAFGSSMLTADDHFGMVGPEAEASLLYVLDLLDRGIVPREADPALITQLFRSGRAATAISGPWFASDLGDAVTYTVAPLPVIEATGESMRPYITVESVMLSPTGAQREVVRRLARHLASVDAARIRQLRARTLSPRVDVEKDDPFLAAFAEQARRAVPMPSSPAMRLTWEPAKQALRKVLRGQADPADALAEAEHRFDDVMRPPPPPASPAPLVVVLGALTLWGAFALVQRSRRGEIGLRRSLPAYRWVLHAVIAVGVLVIAPLLVGAATALFAGPAGELHYVGVANFIEILTARGRPLLSSGSFWLVLLVTVAWTVINVAFHLGIGLGVGLLLSRPILRMKAVYRVLLIIPWAVPSYVTALAWKGMFNEQFGAITGIVLAINDAFGTDLQAISWFAKFSTAFTANIATNVWLGFPFMMVVTIGALTSVPRDVLEAAEVDGASRWQRLRQVTLPIIRPSLMPAITLGAIWTFNMFNVVFLVSGGDPDGSTDILVSEAYRWAFMREAQLGYAAAYAVLIFFLLLGGTRLLERWRTRWAGSGRGDA